MITVLAHDLDLATGETVLIESARWGRGTDNPDWNVRITLSRGGASQMKLTRLSVKHPYAWAVNQLDELRALLKRNIGASGYTGQTSVIPNGTVLTGDEIEEGYRWRKAMDLFRRHNFSLCPSIPGYDTRWVCHNLAGTLVACEDSPLKAVEALIKEMELT